MESGKISTAELKVLLAVEREIKATPKRISELTGLSEAYVRNICRTLDRMKYLHRISRGLYCLTPYGRKVTMEAKESVQ